MKTDSVTRKKLIGLGLMSGNSMDGLDCCVAETAIDKNYSFTYNILELKKYSYSYNDKEILKKTIKDYDKGVCNLSEADKYFGSVMAELIAEQFNRHDIDFISSHGHTIAHSDFNYSIQIGDPHFMCKKYKVPVIYNFRDADIKNGGNGAPLMPFLDWLIFNKTNRLIQIINIGGISNISVVGQNIHKNEVLGFDMGPGMCLIDKFMFDEFGCDIDVDGRIAGLGEVNDKLLHELMQHEFIAKIMPKSASIRDFIEYSDPIIDRYSKLSRYDVLRTLVAFTANSIFFNVNSLLNFSTDNTNVVLSGGGCLNKTLYKDLSMLFGKENICTSLEYGIDPIYKESILMLALGISRIYGISSNIPSVTGSDKNVSLGDIKEYE